MAVLFGWNYFFPVTPPPPPESSDAPVTETHPGMAESGTPPADEFSLGGIREPEPEPTTTGSVGSLMGIQGGSGPGLSVDPLSDVSPRQEVVVQNSEIVLTFDSQGARVTRAEVLRFDEGGLPVQLLPEGGQGALASVLTRGAQEYPLDRFPFELVSDHSGTEGRRLVWELSLEEVTLRKTFTIPPDGYLIQVEQELVKDRAGITAWGLSWAGGMRRTEVKLGESRGAYFNAVVRAEGEVQRKDANAARKGPLEYPGITQFIGIQSKYFLGAIVPKGEMEGPAKLWRIAGEDEEPSMAGEILVDRTQGVAADLVEYDVYIGPLDHAGLTALGLGLEKTVDLGASWIRPLSRWILRLLISLHHVIPNYGFTIILFSSAMNLLFFPLTYKSTKSMRDMSSLKPQMDALKEKYKDDQQKISEATMRLYKEAGVNPLAGCLPILVQMPIFFALYAVLFHTIELRQEPFLFWIRDLSQPDVVFNLPFSLPFIGSGVCLLPIIMGITSFFQSKQTMVDPNQKAMVYMMPVMMTFIFFTMPSGLVLYWLTSNLFTIGTKFFMKPAPTVSVVDDDPTPPKKKKKNSSGGSPAKAGAK